MYSSRPRYSRYSSQFNVPENYSGNAFRKSADRDEVIEVDVDEEEKETSQSVLETEENAESKNNSVAVSKNTSDTKSAPSGFGLDIGRLFKGGIGFEELLIIGLILLMAQGEENDDIVVLLALLLFIK